MSVPEIKICEWYLSALRDDLRAAQVNLDSGGQVPHVDFNGAPEVHEAFQWMGQKWDEHRTELTTHLRALHQALTVTIDSFVQTDEALANPS